MNVFKEFYTKWEMRIFRDALKFQPAPNFDAENFRASSHEDSAATKEPKLCLIQSERLFTPTPPLGARASPDQVRDRLCPQGLRLGGLEARAPKVATRVKEQFSHTFGGHPLARDASFRERMVWSNQRRACKGLHRHSPAWAVMQEGRLGIGFGEFERDLPRKTVHDTFQGDHVMNRTHTGSGFVLKLALLISILILAPNAFGQTETTQSVVEADDVHRLDVIEVTATKRVLSVQDVPFPVNVQSEENIQRLNTSTLEDLSLAIPGLIMQNLGPGQSQVSIRGVSAGQIVRDQPGVKEQVGIYLDETPLALSLFTPDLDLFDLNRVETLRGPQGTLFGAGSIGGTIRLITNQPRLNVTEAKGEIDFNTIRDGGLGGHLKAVVNAPLGDKAAVRLVTYGTRYGGYIDALREEGWDEDINAGRRYGGRFALLLQATDRLSITPRVVYQNITTDGFNRQEVYNLYANRYTTTRQPIQLGDWEQFLKMGEVFEDETVVADAVVNYRLDAVDITYALGYAHRDILVSRDSSALGHSVSLDPLGLPGRSVGDPFKFT